MSDLSLGQRIKDIFSKENRKKFFWLWVVYQAIKGIITLSLIWIPLLLLYLKNHGGG